MPTVAQAIRSARRAQPEQRASGRWAQTEPFKRRRSLMSGWSDTGESITTELALQVSAVVACVRLLAETEGTLDVHAYENREGKRTQRPDDPRTRVLYTPNEHLTGPEFHAWAKAMVALEGNAYSYSDRDRAGRIQTLDPIADQVRVTGTPATGLRYHIQKRGGSYVRSETGYSSEEVLHLRGLTLDGIHGMSVIQHAANTVGIARGIARANARFFAQGMVPSGVFSTPDELSDAAFKRLRQEIDENFAGAGNMHTAPLLEAGVTYQAVQVKPEDALLLAQFGASVQDICRIFRVHPSLVYVDAGGALTYDNPERTMLVHLITNARPSLKMTAAQWFRAMFAPDDAGRWSIRHELDDLTRADALARAQRIAQLRAAAVLTPNEGRKWEALDPVDDDVADSLTAPLNTRIIGPGADQTPAPGAQP